MHTGIVAKLNATEPGRELENSNGPYLSRSRGAIGNSDPRSQAEIDAMHSEIVARLNATLPAQFQPKAAGRADRLATPTALHWSQS